MSCLLKSSSIAHVVAPTMLGTVLCLAAGGCRTHEPRPLDVPGLAEAFLDRAPVSFSMDLAVGPPGDAADGPTLDLDRKSVV